MANGIADLIQSQAGSIKQAQDWAVLLSMLESIGTGSIPVSKAMPKENDTAAGEKNDPLNAEREASFRVGPPESKSLTGEQAWSKPLLSSLCHFDLLVEESIQPHDPHIFFKCCETLSFLVRNDLHITTANFITCVHCIRTFSEISGCGLALEFEANSGQ